MKHLKGELLTGDFSDNTMTFEIEGDFILKHGNYIIVREEDYKAHEMYEALKNAIWIIENKADGFGVDELKSIIKEIEDEN